MKKLILTYFVATLIGSTTYGQVQIDKPINLTGGTGQRNITNLEAPVNGTDAVNKDYVDTKVAAGGGSVPWTNFQVFNSNGTFTVPTGVILIKVQVWGGGGGGGGVSSNCGGGGGGAGGFAEGIYSVTSSTVYGITIGAGGTGGLTTPTNGTDGTSTSFVGTNINISASGGQGGALNNTTSQVGMGGLGGMGSGGYINTTLGCGGNGGVWGGNTATQGGREGTYGSGSGFIGGGGGGIGGGAGSGGLQPGANAAINSGAGGGGGGNAKAGGNGAAGKIVVFW